MSAAIPEGFVPGSRAFARLPLHFLDRFSRMMLSSPVRSFEETLTMKSLRLLCFALLLVPAALPAAAQDPKDSKAPKRYNEELYPLQRGARWYYRVIDLKAPKTPGIPEKADHVVITAESEQQFNIAKSVGQATKKELIVGYNLQVASVGKTANQGLKMLNEQVLVADDGVYKASGAGKTIEPPLRILKANARKGDSWECDSQSENAQLKGTFVADVEEVQVPAGQFQTLVVRGRDFQVGGQRMQVAYWFAPKVGIVKQHVQVGNHEVVLELEKYEPGR
jgi:hypothetical protein